MEYLKEDGLVEYLTFFILLASGAAALCRTIRAATCRRYPWLPAWGLLALLFLFAAGEEISWGQRIFGIETPGFFLDNNLQKETNLHNLVVGNVRINKLVFSQMLTGALVLYFFVLPLLAGRAGFFRRMTLRYGIPLPRWHHILALALAVLLVSQYHLMKAAELREFAFVTIFFLVVLDSPGPCHPLPPEQKA